MIGANRTNLPAEWTRQIVIRLATATDLPAMEWEGEYAHFRKVYAEAFERQTNGLSLLWLVELPGWGLIGQVFIQLSCDRPELADGKIRAYLYSFRMRAAFRRRGIGTQVLKSVEDDLRQRGFECVTLNVAKVNLQARKLYEKHGYRAVAHEPGFWTFQDQNNNWRHSEEPAWRMEKKL